MQRKHNKDIVPTAKMLRKNMTKEEKHLWYDFLRTYPVRFLAKRFLASILRIFTVQRQSLLLSLMVRGIIPKKESNTMKNEPLFLKNTV